MRRQMMEHAAGHDNQTAQALAETLARLDHELAAEMARVREREVERDTALSQLKSARAAASDLSWELEDLEQRLSDLKAQREGPRDPLLERELSSLASRRAALEERVLAQMLLVDELATRAKAAQRALAAEQQASAALLAERERITALLF
ncbi:MAG TPA: hypothetical protein VF897_10530 [Roseiflexaceae bacterium]